MAREVDFSAEIFGPLFQTVQKAFKINLRRGRNISMMFVPGGPNVLIFLDWENENRPLQVIP